MVARLDRVVARAEDRGKPGSLLHVHGMLGEGAEHLAVPLVPDGLGQVLEEVAAADDVQELEAAADRERRDVALERAPEERQLPRVAMRLRGVGLLVPLGPVRRRVDVDAAREDDTVEHVERLVDRLGARRDDERPPARPLHRLDVVERHERRRQLPTRPTSPAGHRR